MPSAPGATALARALVLAASLAGCSGYSVATSPTAPPHDAFQRAPMSSGQVCVFRPASIGAALTIPVRDNGVVVGATQGPSYFCYLAGPGAHGLTVEVSDALPLGLWVDAGHRYFVEHQINVGEDRLVPVGEPRARELLQSCDYATVVGAPKGQPLPPAVPLVAGLLVAP
ncbi:MAG: hypothetical protein HY908_06245 [Myxococcales bacterium]|nr:hypothetical protein [Myxococcales bacterium]